MGEQPQNLPVNLALVPGVKALADCHLQILEPDQFPAWDRFVFQHPNGMVQHTSDWLRVLEKTFPHMRGMVLALVGVDAAAIYAGIPFCEVRSRIFGNRLISVPHATLCPPLLEPGNSEMRAVLDGAVDWARAQSCRRIELRWGQSVGWSANQEDNPCVAGKKFLHHSIDLRQPRNEIWRGLSKGAIRRVINKARDRGLRVVEAADRAELEDFHRLLSQSRHRWGLPALPRSFIRALWEHLQAENRGLWLAKQGDRTLGALFGTMAGRVLSMDYYAEEDAVRGQGVNAMLYWHVICRAQDLGFDCCSLGRTDPSNAGILAYKRHWGAVEEELVYQDIDTAGKKVLSKGGGPARERMQVVFRHMPRFLHRRASAFFYRHWA